MNMKNYKKLVALSLTGALTLIHPETTKAAQYNNTINYEIVPKVKANKNVNIRQSADINSLELGILYKGQTLELKESFGDWYGVLYNNSIAYVNKNYVSIINENRVINNTNPIKRVVTTSNASLFREENYNNIINTIPYNTTIDVYLDTPLFYYVKYNGQLGYVEKTKVLDNNVILEVPNTPVIPTTPVVPNDQITQNQIYQQQIINNYYIEQYNQIINNYYNTDGYDYIRRLER